VTKAFLFISFFILFYSCSQEKGESFYSDGKWYDDGIRGGYKPIFLLKLSSDTVYNFDRQPVKIKVSTEFSGNQIAWGISYSGCLVKAKTKGDVYFLIAEYESTEPRIVFDVNGNADFTDDSIFNIKPDSVFEVKFQNLNNPKAITKEIYRFYRGKIDTSLYPIQKMLTYKMGEVLPVSHLFFAKMKNIKRVVLPDSNTVSLIDIEPDGLFNSKHDKIIAGDVRLDPRLRKKPLKSRSIREKGELIFPNSTYKIVSIDKYGDYISIIPLNKIADTTEILSSISYSNANGKKKTLALNTNKKYSVLYIWGTWCIGCLYQSKGFADLMNKYDSTANFYTLNVGDKRERMSKYISDKKYPFQHYQISSETAEEKLFAEAFPTFIIADKSKKILLRTSSVDEVGRFMKEKMLNK
jgi:thiol-disulfide isomerase/thioredoxin